eukprot:scaffold95369_cov25-Tisochrysis_lutea.AAC.7
MARSRASGIMREARRSPWITRDTRRAASSTSWMVLSAPRSASDSPSGDRWRARKVSGPEGSCARHAEDRRAEPRQESALGGVRLPEDEHALTARREHESAIGREGEGGERLRVPVHLTRGPLAGTRARRLPGGRIARCQSIKPPQMNPAELISSRSQPLTRRECNALERRAPFTPLPEEASGTVAHIVHG